MISRNTRHFLTQDVRQDNMGALRIQGVEYVISCVPDITMPRRATDDLRGKDSAVFWQYFHDYALLRICHKLPQY